MAEIVVLSGSAHPEFARKVCAALGVPVSHTDIKRFSNDCLWVQIAENIRQRDVYVIQPLVPPTQEHLVELLLMLDAARGASAAQVTAVIPHYAYARSDKKDASRISIAGRLVADMLVTAGASAPEVVVEDVLDYLREEFDATVEVRTLREENVSFPLPKELRVVAHT